MYVHYIANKETLARWDFSYIANKDCQMLKGKEKCGFHLWADDTNKELDFLYTI